MLYIAGETDNSFRIALIIIYPNLIIKACIMGFKVLVKIRDDKDGGGYLIQRRRTSKA